MTSADFLTITGLVLVLGAVSWVAYNVGRHQAEREAYRTISQLRGHLRICSQRLERTSYELSSLRDALRTSRTIHQEPPSWMESKND